METNSQDYGKRTQLRSQCLSPSYSNAAHKFSFSLFYLIPMVKLLPFSRVRSRFNVSRLPFHLARSRPTAKCLGIHFAFPSYLRGFSTSVACSYRSDFRGHGSRRRLQGAVDSVSSDKLHDHATSSGHEQQQNSRSLYSGRSSVFPISSSPFVDAVLTSIVGLGIGESNIHSSDALQQRVLLPLFGRPI